MLHVNKVYGINQVLDVPDLVEGMRPRDRRLLRRCSSLSNFSARLDVPKVVPHAHLDRLKVGVELEPTI